MALPSLMPAGRLPDMLLALAIGLAGGVAADFLGMPLPMMLGSLVALALVAVAGLRPFGRAPWLPERLRFALVPVIGVAIGAAFTPDLLAGALRWLPTVAGVILYVPLAHLAGFLIYRRLGGLDRPTALYAAMPGGLIEAIAMGEGAGADRQMLILLQFLRLILCIVLLPFGFMLLTGGPVGSAAGTQMHGADLPLGVSDVVLLVLAGVGGVLLGRRLRLPASVILGPMLCSAALHLTGLTRTVPPDWAIDLTQLVVGTSLGLRFLGLPRGTLARALRLAVANIAAALGLALVLALALHGAVGEATGTVLLAYSPGGVAEMTLVALSLQASVAFVSVHHLVRIVTAVAVTQFAAGRLLRGR